jgi:phosphoadenosine phosphosulfate reductase
MLIETDIFGNVRDKVAMALDRIKTFEPPEGYYVAFSGGKDSVVILDLVKRSGVKFDAHYNITGIDPPELYYFIRDQHPEVQRHRLEKTMWELIVKHMMPPTQMMRFCCEYLKERDGKDRRVITGVRWAESTRRSKRKMVDICFKDSRKSYLHPIIDWTDVDVWDYIRENKIPYCSLYDEGFKRLGCILCPMGSPLRHKIEIKRWPKYKNLYIKAFGKAIQSRKDRGFKETWKSANEMWDWWMKLGHVKKEDPDQTVMFE